jgi:antitoxin (DNA-binding transcriptional repressor) of toxin-antitoxin stability system
LTQMLGQATWPRVTIQVNIGEAKTRLSELVAASLRGEEVILARAGKPVVRLSVLAEAADEERAAIIADRAAKMRAYIGSKKDRFGPNAGNLFSEPEYTDEELDSFSADVGG